MRTVGYWTFLALAAVVAVLAVALGLMRLIDGEMLYALSNTLGVLVLAGLLYGGAYYFRDDSDDPVQGDAAESGVEGSDGEPVGEPSGETEEKTPHEPAEGERVDHIDRAAQATDAD